MGCLLETPFVLVREELAGRQGGGILAAVFGLWDQVIPEERLFTKSPQLSPMPRGPKKAGPREAVADKKAVDDEG